MKLKNVSDTALCFSLTALIILFTAFSDSARQGAKLGMGICEGVILPSLLPILIICNFIIKSRLSRLFEKPFSFIFEKLFSLRKECSGAVILGLISGYPSGALLTFSLFEKGIITSDEAKRIMKFNFCGGFAFIITAVGTVVYGSTKTGIVIYSVNVLSSLIYAFVSGIKSRKSYSKSDTNYTYPDNTQAFCDSVEATVKALALMCAYIILFSVLFRIINPPKAIIPLLEITNGICTEKTVRPDFAAAYISFGGICVHLQLLPFLSKMKVEYKDFLFGRIICAVLSFLLFRAYCLIFPESAEVFNNISTHVNAFSSGGIAFSLIMIIGCAVAILDFENRKIRLHS